MKMKLTIPKGWYKLRKGTVIVKGDKFKNGKTFEKSNAIGGEVGVSDSYGVAVGCIYIRKTKKAK